MNDTDTHEDFTPEELSLIEALSKSRPIKFGKINIEITFEHGKRVSTYITESRSVIEKFRAKPVIIDSNN